MTDEPGFTQTIEQVPGTLEKGTTFAGRYRVVEELGTGGMGQEPRHYTLAFHEPAPHRREAVAKPESMVLIEALKAGLPGLIVLPQRIEIARAPPHKTCAQCRTHQPARLRHVDRLEHAFKLHGLVGLKDIAGPLKHARDPERR